MLAQEIGTRYVIKMWRVCLEKKTLFTNIIKNKKKQFEIEIADIANKRHQ